MRTSHGWWEVPGRGRSTGERACCSSKCELPGTESSKNESPKSESSTCESASILAAVPLLIAASCSGPTGSAHEGTWVGTITTEGNVTTVVNESGSVWGGDAVLVEELSIGVEEGAPETMFGEIAWVHVDGSAIYVVDRQAPAVRVFGLDGAYRRDVGGEGQGPGEYTNPHQVATTGDGRILVVDQGTRRINVYAPDGAVIGTLPLGRGVVWSGHTPLVIDADGAPWLPYRDFDLLDPVAAQAPTYVLRAHSGDGPVGEPRRIPWREVTGPATGRFAPHWHWNATPEGDLLVGGSDAHRFERRAADGTTTVVERAWDPAPVSAGEREYLEHLASLRAATGRAASPIPGSKPAFMGLLGASTGETWVLRQGPGFRIPGCNDRPTSTEEMLASDLCWQDALFFDVFGGDGRFLGSVDVLDEMREQIRRWARTPHLAGDRVTAVAMDEAGTIRVKCYRLELPGEGGRRSS